VGHRHESRRGTVPEKRLVNDVVNFALGIASFVLGGILVYTSGFFLGLSSFVVLWFICGGILMSRTKDDPRYDTKKGQDK